MFRKHTYDLCNLLVLLAASLILLAVCNADVLYMAQSRSLCMSELSVFLQQVRHSPDGMLAWTGAWLTQLFYYPWLGTLVLWGLWSLTYGVLARTFSIPAQWRFVLLIPLIALLVSEVDLGYWIYYLKHPGYWFRESLGLLCVSLLLWLQGTSQTGAEAQDGCRDKGKASLAAQVRGWLAPVLAAGCYLLLGWYALLALVIMGLRCLMARQWTQGSLALALALLVPPVAIRYYTSWPMGKAWMVGFPFIESNQNYSWLLTLPFILMVASVVILALVRRWSELKGRAAIWVPACSLVLMLQYGWTTFSDTNYHTELRMYRDMEEFRWDRLIARMDELPAGPTRQMVVCKNLALINLRHLGDGLFLYPNIGPDPNVNPGLEMHIAQTAAPMFYLQHGLANDAIHWSIENSVEYGLTQNDLRIMTLAAILNGEMKLATKYINMLRRTLFGSSWAKRYFPLTIHPEWIEDYPELRVMKELHDSDLEYIVGDEGDCEFRIYRHFANTLYNSSPLFQEVCLAYSLMLKDEEIAPLQLSTYMEYHRGQPLPRYYEEALTLFRQMHDGTLTRQEVDQMVPVLHGQTYKWFFFKVNDAKTY